MKKFLTLVSVVAVAGAVSVASAMDRTGKIGLGYQQSFTSYSGSTGGDWSLKYGINHALNAGLAIGFDYGNKGLNKLVSFGGRLLYDVVEMENSDLYLGLGFGWNQDQGARVLAIQVPLGFEWSFAGLPEVGFSAETGFVYNYRKDAGGSSFFGSAGDKAGGSFGLGVHYYF